MVYLEEELRISILDHLSERISHSSESCNSTNVHQRSQSAVSPPSHLTNTCVMWWQPISASHCANLWSSHPWKHPAQVCSLRDAFIDHLIQSHVIGIVVCVLIETVPCVWDCCPYTPSAHSCFCAIRGLDADSSGCQHTCCHWNATISTGFGKMGGILSHVFVLDGVIAVPLICSVIFSCCSFSFGFFCPP